MGDSGCPQENKSIVGMGHNSEQDAAMELKAASSIFPVMSDSGAAALLLNQGLGDWVGWMMRF